ncbi:GRAS family transcription factor [Zostera marina]|uniref:GRAS family transcription factor n=1 Tax=Zostera marina TaxID=29655 RepID=A0A0K9NZ50_ZOSMR|nr:GRAS family transcription factor [Zostera marina]
MKPSTATFTAPIPLPKISFSINSTNSSNSTTNTYEHTSLLDQSTNSSPSSAPPIADVNHNVNNGNSISTDPFDDWDPLTFLLLDSSSDSTTPTHQDTSLVNFSSPSAATFDMDSLFPPPPPSHNHSHPALFPFPSPIFEQTHLDQLIRAAQAIEANDRNLACVILSRLTPHLNSPSGPPLQRASFYFKEALHSLLPLVDEDENGFNNNNNSFVDDPFSVSLSTVDLVRKISALKSFSDLSPLPQFSSFTANQSILDSIVAGGDHGFSRPIHIIDFDIGVGGQWSSFLHEIATRSRAQRGVMVPVQPPSVIMTVIVVEESLESSLMADNLRDFAVGVGIRLDIDFVRIGGMGPAALGAVRLSAGDNVAVSFTPAVVRLLGGGGGSGGDAVGGFLRFVRRVAPKVVVFVDTEPCCVESGPDRSFRRSFVGGLDYYSVVLESLDSAVAVVGFGEEQVGRIEKALFRPKIWSAVRSWGVQGLPWRDILERAGFKSIPFSEFTESQAEWLTRRAPVGGFHVARRDGSITLSWQERELSATSAWKC